MDKFVKQGIDARRDAIYNAYEVGAGEQKKIDAVFAEMEKLGTSCKDVQEFEAELAKSPVNQKYLDLFTEIATSAPAKATAGANVKKPSIAGIVAEGVVEGAASRTVDEVKRSVLPTRAAVHQKAYDEVRKVPGVGDAIDIGQKASYLGHLGKLFSKKKKD